MKIAILGAGSLGSVFGGSLASAGSEVSLISRNAAYVDAVNDHGLVLIEGSQRRIIEVSATSDPKTIGLVDLLIVLVKSFDTREAIISAKSIVGPTTVVLTLQNGLGNEAVIDEELGRGFVVAGRTFVGGDAIAPGEIVAGLRGKHTVIGELDGVVTGRIKDISALFNKAGIDTEISTNINSVIWGKLLVNVATGAIAGITGLPYGLLYQVSEVHEVALNAVNEAITVAGALEIELSVTDPEQIWQSAGTGLAAEFRTSILQSLDRGSITEVDFINGAVVSAGNKVGVPTPVNSTLVGCIKGIEARNRANQNPQPRPSASF